MSAAGQCSIGLRTIRLGQGFREAGLLRPVTTEAGDALRGQAMHTPPHLLLNLYAYVPLSNLSGWACALPDRETAGPGWVRPRAQLELIAEKSQCAQMRAELLAVER